MGIKETVIATYKDRLIRLSYDWFEKVCKKFNTTIVVINKGYCFSNPCGCKGFVRKKTDRNV